MNCIDKQLLQKYIDGECTEDETAAVKKHLEDCLACRGNHAEMAKLSEGIKRALNSLTTENMVIPEFREPESLPSNKTRIRYLIIGTLAAACILMFVLLITDKKSELPQGKITIVQITPMEVDANRTAGDQDFVIEVLDDKGQHSEYFLNN
jgi:predicted anti-sigma-YlaC factor YlaD